MKRVQIEPHLSVTGACSAEWIPIKPKTDSAFLFAMIHVLLHETAREKLDIPFLKAAHVVALSHRRRRIFPARSGNAESRWSSIRPAGGRCRSTPPGIDPALEGTFTVDGIEVGPDQETIDAHARPRPVRPSRTWSPM